MSAADELEEARRGHAAEPTSREHRPGCEATAEAADATKTSAARSPGGHERLDPGYLNGLPLLRHGGPVHVIGSAEQAAAALQEVSALAILGFDTESRPSFDKGVFYP